MGGSNKTPDNSEDQQGQNAVTEISMPLNEFITQIDGHKATGYTNHQQPMKYADW